MCEEVVVASGGLVGLSPEAAGRVDELANVTGMSRVEVVGWAVDVAYETVLAGVRPGGRGRFVWWWQRG